MTDDNEIFTRLRLKWPNRFKRERMRTVSKERGEYLTCLHGLGTVLPSELEIWHRVPGEKMIVIRLLWPWTTKIRGTVSSPSFESPLKWTRVRRSIIHYPIISLNFVDLLLRYSIYVQNTGVILFPLRQRWWPRWSWWNGLIVIIIFNNDDNDQVLARRNR